VVSKDSVWITSWIPAIALNACDARHQVQAHLQVFGRRRDSTRCGKAFLIFLPVTHDSTRYGERPSGAEPRRATGWSSKGAAGVIGVSRCARRKLGPRHWRGRDVGAAGDWKRTRETPAALATGMVLGPLAGLSMTGAGRIENLLALISAGDLNRTSTDTPSRKYLRTERVERRTLILFNRSASTCGGRRRGQQRLPPSTLAAPWACRARLPVISQHGYCRREKALRTRAIPAD